jgi:signal transduction histidine kinase
VDPSLDERLAYLRLDESDLARLAELRPIVEAEADRFVDVFYRHLLTFEGPRALLTDPEVRDRLLASQREYLISLTSAKIDPTYAEQRVRIGRIHERVGLSTSWYLGAYEIYLSELASLIDRHFERDPAAAAAARSALWRRVLLDAQLAMEAYIETREAQLEFANRELASAQRGLSREVVAKTAALRETTERAQAAEQLASVGMLAAGLAHEIGTPMGVIRGHAESLEGAVGDDRARWRVRTIVEQIDRITNIMQALLNLARPRAPVSEPVDLGAVIDTAVSFVREKLQRRAIDVERRYAKVPLVQGDPEKLQQLFLNLILNAADAMRGGGTLTLSLECDDREVVRARVADTGPGIDAGHLERVFEPFFTTKEAGQGSGLGLMIARSIALDHGGDLCVASEPGEGCEFAFELPVGD